MVSEAVPMEADGDPRQQALLRRWRGPSLIAAGLLAVLWLGADLLFRPPALDMPTSLVATVVGAWFAFGVIVAAIVSLRDIVKIAVPAVVLAVVVVLALTLGPTLDRTFDTLGPALRALARFSGTWVALGALLFTLLRELNPIGR